MALYERQPVAAAPTLFFVYSDFFALLALVYCVYCVLLLSRRTSTRPFLGVKLVRLLLCFLLFSGLLNNASADTLGRNPALVYTREQLLALSQARLHPGARPEIPAELRRRRRGCTAGVRRRERRRRYKPCLPSVITGNVRSLLNKTDELAALTRLQREYRECSLLHFTETWLTEQTPDSLVQLNGFHLIRADRDTRESGKKKGGGVAMFVNNKWCNPGNIYIKEQRCTRDIELLAVSIRPYYLPREFSHVIAVTVYIPPSANADSACELLHSVVSQLQTAHPQAFFLITGDFNHASLSATLPNFHQFVDCPTRDNRTLDLLYSNTPGAYSSSPLPPLGRSDHNLVHLLPAYTPLVRKQPPTTKCVKQWSEEASEALQDCFSTTDWEVLCGPHGQDIDSLTECITDYINFCVETTVPTRRVRCFSNNKPWVTSELRALLLEKRRAFKSGDREDLRRVQRDLKRKIRECKASYRRKMEDQLQNNNVREVWRGLQTISGQGKGKKGDPVPGERDWANQLNLFFNRFDAGLVPSPSSQNPVQLTSSSSCLLAPSTSPPSPPPSLELSSLPPPPPPVFTPTVDQVRLQLRQTRASKATGPDGISSRLLRDCADQLCQVVCYIFDLSLRMERVPAMWKTSCVVPVPKTLCPKEPNHFRPVALTSHLMKALERIILNHLRPLVSPNMDPLQFAYQPGIGTDDAVLYLLQRSLSHLEDTRNTVKMTFFDFSSAFNTIQPSLLRVKMERAGVSDQLAAWTMDYLTDRPQYVRLQDCVSDVVVCSTGAPQGTVLSPFLFTLYTSDFRYSTDSCHLQKFSDDTAIIGCVSEGNDCEYRKVIMDFVYWCEQNHLQLNASKTKEMVIDFHRKPSHTPLLNIQGLDIERVRTYKYLGVHLNNRLDWTDNTDSLYKKGQCRLYLLRRLASFGVSRPLLRTFYDTVVASMVFYAVVCWGGGCSERDKNRLNRLIKRASSVCGCPLDSIEVVGERRTLSKLSAIIRNSSHPLHQTVNSLRSTFSNRLVHPRCKKERFRRSFIPASIRLYNSAL